MSNKEKTLITAIPDGDYELTLVDVACAKKIFNKLDVIPTGHAWEAIIQSYCSSIKLDIKAVEFDSESDYFFAYADNEKVLKDMSIAFNKLIDDSSLLTNILEKVDFDDSYTFSIDEFIDNLESNGRDLNKKLELGFYMTFDKKEPVNSACQIASNNGYDCLFQTVSPPYYFAGVIKDFAKKELLQSRVSYFLEIAEKLGGSFIDCEDFSRIGSPLNVFATDWKQYMPDISSSS